MVLKGSGARQKWCNNLTLSCPGKSWCEHKWLSTAEAAYSCCLCLFHTQEKDVEILGLRDSTACKVLTLHEANPNCILSTKYDLPSAISELGKPWTILELTGIAPPKKENNKNKTRNAAEILSQYASVVVSSVNSIVASVTELRQGHQGKSKYNRISVFIEEKKRQSNKSKKPKQTSQENTNGTTQIEIKRGTAHINPMKRQFMKGRKYFQFTFLIKSQYSQYRANS